MNNNKQYDQQDLQKLISEDAIKRYKVDLKKHIDALALVDKIMESAVNKNNKNEQSNR